MPFLLALTKRVDLLNLLNEEISFGSRSLVEVPRLEIKEVSLSIGFINAFNILNDLFAGPIVRPRVSSFDVLQN